MSWVFTIRIFIEADHHEAIKPFRHQRAGLNRGAVVSISRKLNS
jgi:hypothetical protein